MRNLLSIFLISIYISVFGIEKAFASSDDDSYRDDNSSEFHVNPRKDTAYFQYQNLNKLPIVKNDIPRKRKKEIIKNFEENHLQDNNNIEQKSKKRHVIRPKDDIKEEREFFIQEIEKFFVKNTEMQLSSEMPKIMASFIDVKDKKKYRAKALNFRRFLRILTDEKSEFYDNRYRLETIKRRLYLKLNNDTENNPSKNNIIESLGDIKGDALSSGDETEEENVKENEIIENHSENKEKSPEISFESSNDNSIQISTENNINSHSIQSDSIELTQSIPNNSPIQVGISRLTLTEITQKMNQEWKLKNENDTIGKELIEKYNYILTKIFNIIKNSNKLNTDQGSFSELQKYLEKLEVHLPNHFDKIEKKPEEKIFIDLTDDK